MRFWEVMQQQESEIDRLKVDLERSVAAYLRLRAMIPGVPDLPLDATPELLSSTTEAALAAALRQRAA